MGHLRHETDSGDQHQIPGVKSEQERQGAALFCLRRRRRAPFRQQLQLLQAGKRPYRMRAEKRPESHQPVKKDDLEISVHQIDDALALPKMLKAGQVEDIA